MNTEKNLFIPLKSEYYHAFKDGRKQHELRRYGPRWNEDTCSVGRRVTLSLGYGKKFRVNGTVTKFEKIDISQLANFEVEAFTVCYGRQDLPIAKITIKLDGV